MTEKESKPPFDVVAALDQFQAQSTNVAVIVACYYNKLLEGGVTLDHAGILTLAFQNSFWANFYSLAHQQPPGESDD